MTTVRINFMRFKVLALLFCAVLAGGVLCSNSLALAVVPDPKLHGLDVTVGKTGYSQDETVPSIVGRGLGTAMAMITVVLLLLLLYAGLRWMIARGNAEDVEKAKDIIEAALIGLVIVLSAWGLASWVFGRLRPSGPLPAPVVLDTEYETRVPIGSCTCNGFSCQVLYTEDIVIDSSISSADLKISACEKKCGELGFYGVYTPGSTDCANSFREARDSFPPSVPSADYGVCLCDRGFGKCVDVIKADITPSDSLEQGCCNVCGCTQVIGVPDVNGQTTPIETGIQLPSYLGGKHCSDFVPPS